MSKYNVYGLGNALVDMEFEVEDGFLNLMRVDKGVMTLVDEEEQHRLLAHLDAFEGTRGSGGSAANTLIAVSAMGGSSYYACKVADDELGHFYLHDLKAAGVDTNINGVHADGITGKCLVLVTPDAERTMQTYLGISAELSVHEISEPHIRESQYLYMEGYLVTSPSAREANIHARKIAEANGVRTALTFSDPTIVEFFHSELTETIGDGIDLLFCNEAEALAYTRKESIDDAIDVIRTFAKSFAITLGSRGAIIHDGGELIEIAPNPTHAIDSNGAGDMFAGAYLYGITNGLGVRTAGRLASLASSKVVSQFGPRLQIEEYTRLVQAITAA